MMSVMRGRRVNATTSSPVRSHLLKPTPERLSKSAFTSGPPHRCVSTVEALFDAGAIGEVEKCAASRLRQDWLYARYGYVDHRDQKASGRHDKHNMLSWRMTRAHVGVGIEDVKRAVKTPIFDLLALMLVDELSFSGMARLLLPTYSDSVARGRISAQCSLALRTLSEVYADLDCEKRSMRRAGSRSKFD